MRNKKEKTRFGISVIDNGNQVFFIRDNPLNALKKIVNFILSKYQIGS
jgi:hypothetical protein